AGARPVARVRVVALRAGSVAAGRTGRLEPVVVAGTRLAGVLVRAVGPGVTAVRAVGLVVRLAGPGTVAGVGVVASARRPVAAGRPGRLEPVVVAGPREAGVLVRALRARVAAIRPVGGVVGLTAPGSVAAIRRVARSAGRIAARGPGHL